MTRSTSTSSTRTFITPPTTVAPEPNKKSVWKIVGGSLKSKLPWILVVMLIFAIFFLFGQYREAQKKLHLGSKSNISSQQINSVVTRVSKIAILPKQETPTIATVVHASQLKSQAFFLNAQDGDQVLIYHKAKEAILYRPSSNQIVTIAPISESGSSPVLGPQK